MRRGVHRMIDACRKHLGIPVRDPKSARVDPLTGLADVVHGTFIPDPDPDPSDARHRTPHNQSRPTTRMRGREPCAAASMDKSESERLPSSGRAGGEPKAGRPARPSTSAVATGGVS